MVIQKDFETEKESIDQVIADLKDAPVPLQYKANILYKGTPVILLIDIHPGGGFESSLEYTNLAAPISVQFTSLKATVAKKDTFRFALHDEGVMDRVGKIFGMQDAVIGYPEFDKQLIIKTNDPDRVKEIFSNATVRKAFQSLSDFSLQISDDAEKSNAFILEFMIDRAITETKELKKVYDSFVEVFDRLNE